MAFRSALLFCAILLANCAQSSSSETVVRETTPAPAVKSEASSADALVNSTTQPTKTVAKVGADAQLESSTQSKVKLTDAEPIAASKPARSASAKPAPQPTATAKAVSAPDKTSAASKPPPRVQTTPVTTTPEAPTASPPAAIVAKAPDHSSFSQLLSRYVSAAGDVDYAGLKANRAALDAYLATLAEISIGSEWSKDEAHAYLINLYNATTLRLIIDNYPIKSITDLDGGKPWDKPYVNMGGKKISLNTLENEIIRKRYNEPRIHFAVNCAAVSCPPLRNEAFVAKRLDSQLQEQTRKFLNNPTYTKVDGNTVQLSKIFEWYAADFPSLVTFVGNYVDLPDAPQITYAEYDWSLNSK